VDLAHDGQEQGDGELRDRVRAAARDEVSRMRRAIDATDGPGRRRGRAEIWRRFFIFSCVGVDVGERVVDWDCTRLRACIF
jgi:hypothetical protein